MHIKNLVKLSENKTSSQQCGAQVRPKHSPRFLWPFIFFHQSGDRDFGFFLLRYKYWNHIFHQISQA